MKIKLALILLGICIILNIIGFMYIQKHEQTVDNTIQLYDICHNLFGDINPDYHKITELWIVILILLILYKACTRKDIYRFLIVCTISYIIRVVIFSSTLIPSSIVNCKIGDNNVSCNDMMYSGHITVILLSLLFLWYHNIVPFHIVILGTLIPAYIILATKNHYTSDIIVSIVINSLLFFQIFNVNLNNIFHF